VRSAHPRRDVSFPLLDVPLRFERTEDLVDQPRQSFGNRGVPELADELQFLQPQDCVAGVPQPLDPRQVGARRPGKSGFDPIEDGRGAFFEAPQIAVPQCKGMSNVRAPGLFLARCLAAEWAMKAGPS